MGDKLFGPFIGIITSLVSFDIWENLFLSFLLAFIGGVAAWMGRKLCDSMYLKYKTKRKTKNETKN